MSERRGYPSMLTGNPGTHKEERVGSSIAHPLVFVPNDATAGLEANDLLVCLPEVFDLRKDRVLELRRVADECVC